MNAHRQPTSARRPIPVRREAVKLAMAAMLIAFADPLAGAEPVVHAVTSIGLTVGDMDRSVAFYRDVLQFECLSDGELSGEAAAAVTGLEKPRVRVVQMKLGDELLVLTQHDSPRGRPMPADSRSNDLWFQHVAIIVHDMDAAYSQLQRFQVRHASPAPQRLPDWNPAAGGIEAFYFRDPDGHFLEILHVPPGRGNPKWQRPTTRLFLGIDHTAIVVADTQTSLRFYRDLLGMRVVGTSENYGVEQERLNNVPGARLRITTLRAAEGPGVELLEYLAPRDGRPRPVGTTVHDLMHWQTSVSVTSRDAAIAALHRADPRARLSEAVPVTRSTAPRWRTLVRDPDGHAVELIEHLPDDPSAEPSGSRESGNPSVPSR
jgi:catechol 2,3-dioxygenase-like lactoylglutathione lyase family enzyme